MLAHVGHWWTEALYVAPVLVVGGWLFYADRRDKRRAARGPGAAPDGAT